MPHVHFNDRFNATVVGHGRHGGSFRGGQRMIQNALIIWYFYNYNSPTSQQQQHQKNEVAAHVRKPSILIQR
jgi:hypothetical protein